MARQWQWLGSIPIAAILRADDRARSDARFLTESSIFRSQILSFLLRTLAENADLSCDFEGVADGWGQGVIAANEAVELVVEDVADGWLEGQPFFLAAGRVGPQDLFGHLEPGRSALGEDLKTGLWQEAAGIAPSPTMISAK